MKNPSSNRSSWKRAERHPHFVVLFFCVAIIGAAAVLRSPQPGDPTVRIGRYPVPSICTFRRLTGWPCPGCGLVRSLTAAVHGDFPASWSFHRLGIITMMYLLAQILTRTLIIGLPRRLIFLKDWSRRLDRGLIILAALFALNWLVTLIQLRNG